MKQPASRHLWHECPKKKLLRKLNKKIGRRKGPGLKAKLEYCHFQGPEGPCSLRRFHPTVGRLRRWRTDTGRTLSKQKLVETRFSAACTVKSRQGVSAQSRPVKNSSCGALTRPAIGASLKRRYPIWSPTPSRGFSTQPRAHARPRLAPCGSLKLSPQIRSLTDISHARIRVYLAA